MHCVSRLTACALLGAVLIVSPLSAQDNLVANGSFELDTDGNGEPDSWSTSGTVGMEQTLTIDVGSDGTRTGRLVCTKFVSGSPASHAMICQNGHVAVRAGQWYRLTWRAKARDMRINAVRVALSNIRNWSNAGLSYSFPVGSAWRDYEHVFKSEQDVPAGENVVKILDGLVKGRTGFFRVEWSPAGGSAPSQNLRCMVIESYDDDDSVFGMNHAYGWPFMLQLAKKAGLTWWRDWSVKWHEVEPKKGQFDFSGTDPQIDRVIDEGLNLEVMFPFPSCDWATTADMDAIRKAESNEYRHRVMRYACAPNNKEDFRNYIARSVRHYRDRIQYFQVFNEPVYTHYSLPQRLGYKVSDYIHWMNIAADAIRSERKDAVIVGGMGIWASSSWTHDFVKEGGLAKVDILDLHNYPVTADPERYEPDMAELARMMKERGEMRPMWLTEYGCYADDDPYRTPQKVGDAAMSKSVWPSEREAAQALVQSAAVFCTHGLRKIFLHAGSCGPINGSSAGGVFFEYGGTPRKMLPAVSALSRLMDADFEPVDVGPQPDDMRVYLFKVERGLLAIAWTRAEKPVRVTASDDITVVDIMGNTRKERAVELTATPVYFLTNTLTPEELKRILSKRQ